MTDQEQIFQIKDILATVTTEAWFAAYANSIAKEICQLFDQSHLDWAKENGYISPMELSKEIGNRVAAAWEQGHNDGLKTECVEGHIKDLGYVKLAEELPPLGSSWDKYPKWFLDQYMDLRRLEYIGGGSQ